MKFRNFKMVDRVVFGRGCIGQLDEILAPVKHAAGSRAVFLVDAVFEHKDLASRLPVEEGDQILFVDVSEHEPKTTQVDELTEEIRAAGERLPAGVVGIGGGSVMDIAKAVSVMLTNPGSSADYQGWDLVKYPSLWHAAVPTLAGTGAEVSRTAVLTGPVRKLGINSDYSVFNQAVLDPDMLSGVPRDQWFYTGMDCYIHCVESLEGTFLNAFSRAYGEKALELCREVFLGDIYPAEADEKLMMASFCGGMSIAWSQVGVCHALSYGMSYVLGLRHGIGNSVVFDYLEEFYPKGVVEFKAMVDKHGIDLPRNLTRGLSEESMEKMIDVALSMAPLWENALGPGWKEKMTRDRVRELYSRM
ncbi:MAG: iron-containing alcohol dehydrogenase [Deltaproteobacteria bacterium]|nr:iron-containing alcohol dehydrogenase [Deltaproteobacteria bacterium]